MVENKKHIPDFGLTQVTVSRVSTDVSDFVVSFYGGDIREHKVRRIVREKGYEVVKTEQLEGGHLYEMFIEREP